MQVIDRVATQAALLKRRQALLPVANDELTTENLGEINYLLSKINPSFTDADILKAGQWTSLMLVIKYKEVHMERQT